MIIICSLLLPRCIYYLTYLLSFSTCSLAPSFYDPISVKSSFNSPSQSSIFPPPPPPASHNSQSQEERYFCHPMHVWRHYAYFMVSMVAQWDASATNSCIVFSIPLFYCYHYTHKYIVTTVIADEGLFNQGKFEHRGMYKLLSFSFHRWITPTVCCFSPRVCWFYHFHPSVNNLSLS